jgi:uncharacterized protein
MMTTRSRTFHVGGVTVTRGQTQDIRLAVSERYTGDPVSLPVRVIRARRPGPTLFVTAGIHGDELNGVGVLHELAFGPPLRLSRGTVIFVLVANVFGFETQARYMPDRRDLNRCFPGTKSGSLSSRLAFRLFNEVVKQSNYGIDLHSAAAPRMNFPNVRGDLKNPAVRQLAKAFGCEIIVHGKGPEGSLRQEATGAGCPTILLEAGETCKIEPGVLELGIRGVHNVLKNLQMMQGELVIPPHQSLIEKATWVRAQEGGILRYHVSPGARVETGQPLATTVSVFGEEQNVLTSPVDGIILGMTSLPTVKPGEPVCHIAIPRKLRGKENIRSDRLHRRVQRDLATSISVSEREVQPDDSAEREEH